MFEDTFRSILFMFKDTMNTKISAVSTGSNHKPVAFPALNSKLNKTKSRCLSDSYSSPQQPLPCFPVYDVDCQLIDTDKLANILGIKAETIVKARCTGLGDFPPFVKFNRSIRYRIPDVVDWLNRHTHVFSGDLS